VTSTRDEFDRELRRVVDRLNSMPLNRAAASQDAVLSCAEMLVSECRRAGVPIPASAVLPELAPQGFGALIAVLGQDLQDAADESDLTAGLNTLVTLRRALP
jgi:hypothetical protein